MTVAGGYLANGYGLYDMAGNVWELCLDQYDPGYYKKSLAVNPLSGHDSIKAVTNNYEGLVGTESYGVVVGASMVIPCAQQTAMIDIRIMDTMATDFAVCQIGFKNTVDAEIDDNTILLVQKQIKNAYQF